MLERLSRSKRNLALGLLALGLVWFSWTVRAVLNPVILGYLSAFVLAPLVRALERRGWGRRAAANLIFLGFFIITTLLLWVVIWQGRSLVHDVGHSEAFRRTWSEVESWAGSWLSDESDAAPSHESAAAGEAVSTAEGRGEVAILARILEELSSKQNQARALEGVAAIWPYLRSFFGSLLALVTLLTLLPIYAYYLLFELDRIHAFVYRYLPRAEKERFARVGQRIGEVLAHFFRGRLLICLLKGLVITLGLLLVHVPYAVFLGMVSGFLSLVPFVGPMLGFVGAYILAAFPPTAQVTEQMSGGGPEWMELFWAFLRTGGVFAVAELLEGYLFLPWILGDSLGLHPVVVLASIFIGGAALGMFGFLIALPLTAALVILVQELVLPALADFADEGEGDDGGATQNAPALSQGGGAQGGGDGGAGG